MEKKNNNMDEIDDRSTGSSSSDRGSEDSMPYLDEDRGRPTSPLEIEGKFQDRTALNLQNNLTDLYNDEILTDLDITVSDKTFHCHKIVLCAVSNYFRSMFKSGMAEANARETTLPSISSTCFQSILNYIYRGADIFDEESIEELLEASVVLQMRDLEECCIEFMSESLSPSNSLSIWELCRKHNCEEISDKAWNLSVTQFEKVINNTDLSDVSEDLLVKLLCDKDLKFSNEDVLCKAIFQWIEIEPEERSKCLPSLMNHVCLPEVSGDFLYKNLFKSKLIKKFPVLGQMVDDAIKCHLIPDEKRGVLLKQKTIRDKKKFRRVLVVVGGNILDDGSLNNDMSCWDDHSESWYSLSSLPHHIGQDFSSCSLDNKIYVSGGSKSPAAVMCYDPARNSWSSEPKLNAGRESHSMVTVNSCIFVIGGRNDKQKGPDKMVASIEKLNPESSKWEVVGQMTPVAESFATGVIDEKIYIYGGFDEFGLSKRICSFDVSTNAYTNITEMDRAYRGFRSVQIQHDRVHLISTNGDVLVHTGDDKINHLFHIPDFCRTGFALVSDGTSIIIVGGKIEDERQGTIQSLCLEDQILSDMEGLEIPIDELRGHYIVIPVEFLLQKGMNIGETAQFFLGKQI